MWYIIIDVLGVIYMLLLRTCNAFIYLKFWPYVMADVKPDDIPEGYLWRSIWINISF